VLEIRSRPGADRFTEVEQEILAVEKLLLVLFELFLDAGRGNDAEELVYGGLPCASIARPGLSRLDLHAQTRATRGSVRSAEDCSFAPATYGT
jgi:hypothetical protein